MKEVSRPNQPQNKASLNDLIWGMPRQKIMRAGILLKKRMAMVSPINMPTLS